MELSRGKALQPPVMANVEVPYDAKEDRMMGSKGGAPVKFLPIKY